VSLITDLGKVVSVGTDVGETIIVGVGSEFSSVVPHPTTKIDNTTIE
jgi:hypothetical protein